MTHTRGVPYNAYAMRPSFRTYSVLLAALFVAACEGDPMPKKAASRPLYYPTHIANSYDVVAYVQDGRAEAGSRAHQLVHAGGLYQFASAEHLQAFKANPDRYMPTYDGFCACSMAKGNRMWSSGRDFAIHQGKVYLFGSAELLAEWRRDVDGMIVHAAEHWAALK